MTMPPFAAGLSAQSTAALVNGTPGQTPAARPARKSLMMRKYQIASLQSDGEVRFSDQIGPAMPIFESAFSAFARGTLINTTVGPVAVEDLVPGMEIVTSDGSASPLLWIGSMTLVPTIKGVPVANAKLARVMSGTFGVNSPGDDLMAGPGARVLTRPAGMGEMIDSDRVLTPVQDLTDGMNVIEITPPRAVVVYHICLQEHAIIRAGGLDVETFHPGPGFERHMGENMLALFMSLFPHVNKPADFGSLAHQRLPFKTPHELIAA